MKRLAVLLLVALASARGQDVVPVVCSSCNREVLQRDARFCPNCGAPLAGGEAADEAEDAEGAEGAAPPSSSGATPESADRSLAAAIRADARFAAARSASEPAAALAAVRNALALAALEPGAVDAAGRKALVERETALLAALAAENSPCPRCHGTGRVDAPPPPKPPKTRGGNFKSIESVAVTDFHEAGATRPCPFCGGAGRARRAVDRKRLAGLVGLGARDFARAARAAGRESAGGVWLPAGAPAPGPEGIATLKRALPSPCGDCAGTGTRPCLACGGFGRVACGNRSFHNAAPKPASSDPRTVESAVLPSAAREICPSCGGARNDPRPVACPDCGGRGLAACRTCTGTGSAEKR